MSGSERLKVLIVSSEVAPFAKSGGLGDVVGSLPAALLELGVDVRVVMPKYKNISSDLMTSAQFLNYYEVQLAWRSQTASIHRQVQEDGVPVYFIENDYYFGRDQYYGFADDNERFAFFCKATLEMLPVIGFRPDIIHLNDWQTGPIALLLSEIYRKVSFYSRIQSLFTIHNLQYQGVFPMESLYVIDLSDYYFNSERLEFYGQVSYMKAGLIYSNAISTVSETYAREILDPRFAYGLQGVLQNRRNETTGILNGIDYKTNNPETDKNLFKNYSITTIKDKKVNKTMLQRLLQLPERDVPMLSIISRLADQKGLDLIAHIMDELMREDIQLVVLGTGDGRYEYMLKQLQMRYPDKLSANITFDNSLAQKIYAATDMFLMPSLFEPCGLGQLISMRYGAAPIVRRTGGLADTVNHFNSFLCEGNGFVFDDYTAEALLSTIRQALQVYSEPELWQALVKNAMSCNFSWNKSAKDYAKLYLKLKAPAIPLAPLSASAIDAATISVEQIN